MSKLNSVVWRLITYMYVIAVESNEHETGSSHIVE